MRKVRVKTRKGALNQKKKYESKKERVAQTKSGQALASDILKRTSRGQNEERTCEQSENPEPKKFKLRGWDFQEENKFYHKWTGGIPRKGHGSHASINIHQSILRIFFPFIT